MPTDPAGNYTLPPIYLALAGTTILAPQHNAPLEDLAQAMSQRLMRDGRNGMVGPLNLGSFKGINAAPGTAATDLATVGQGVPIGAVMDFAATIAPNGWLLCGGQEVNRADYPVLFSVIGTTYGNGNGSTTFNLPDYRGRVLAGLDTMVGNAGRMSLLPSGTMGAVGGEQQVSLVHDQMPAHAHLVSGQTAGVPDHQHFVQGRGGGPGSGLQGAGGGPLGGLASDPAGGHGPLAVSGSTDVRGAGAAHLNIQPTAFTNKIIKATY